MSLLGPTMAGKSSTMKSLIAGKSVLVHVKDRTQVADIRTLDVTAQDSILLFDHGGHEIYRIMSPLFIAHNSVIMLVHNISQINECSVRYTTNILQHSLEYHPQNQVHLALTHIDEVSADNVSKNSDYIEKKVHACIDQEMQSLICLSHADDERSKLVAQLQTQKDNMKVFLLSNKTYKGMDSLTKFLTEFAVENRVTLPQKWVQFYTVIMSQKQKFFKVTELQQLFKSLYSKPREILQQSQITKMFLSALAYYHAAGHVLFYPDNPVLKDYVFHNKDFILDLSKSIFNHSLKDGTDFSELRKTTPAFHIELMLNQYESEGLLHIKLIRFLWHQYGLKEQEEAAVLEIMKKLHLCYEVDVHKTVLFMPWFIKTNNAPNSLDLGKLYQINQKCFSVLLECAFNSRIPINIFEAIQVQVQKTAVEKHYSGSRYAWHDGIQVKVGTLEIRALRKAEKATIQLCVCGPTNDVAEVWQVTSEVFSDLESILQPLLGVIKFIYFKCIHCLMKGLNPVKQRLPSEVLNNKSPDVSFDRCKEEDIPRILVIAPAGGLPSVVNILITYTKTGPPGKF